MKAERFVGRPDFRALCAACGGLPAKARCGATPARGQAAQLPFLTRARESTIHPVDHVIVDFSRGTRRIRFTCYPSHELIYQAVNQRVARDENGHDIPSAPLPVYV